MMNFWLARARTQVNSKLSPQLKIKGGGGVDFRVDIHQADDLIGQMTNILACLVDDPAT
jgi:hypothetical protein